jgi:hypothetical protein
MSGPFLACLFITSLSNIPQECIIQAPRPVAFAERWGSWSCDKEMTCQPAPDVPSVAHGE